MPKKKPEYRNNRTHTAFLKSMSEIYTEMDDIERSIMQHLSSEFAVDHYDADDLGLETVRVLDNRDLNDLCRTKRVAL